MLRRSAHTSARDRQPARGADQEDPLVREIAQRGSRYVGNYAFTTLPLRRQLAHTRMRLLPPCTLA